MKQIAILALLLPFVPIPACSAGTGEPIIPVELALQGRNVATISTGAGWTVQLDEARIVLGPIYAFAPRDELVTWRWAPVAFAHGGFDALDGRKVKLELLEQRVVDVLDAAPQVIPTLAEEGESTELQVRVEPPTDANAPATNGFDAWVKGVATRDDEVVPFEGGLSLGTDPILRRIQGIDLSGRFVEGSRLTIEVDATTWLDGVDFSRVDETIDADGQAHAAWRIGARSPFAFHASLNERETE